MEWLYSFALDARHRPWGKPLGYLFSALRTIIWRMNRFNHEVFMIIAVVDDILNPEV